MSSKVIFRGAEMDEFETELAAEFAKIEGLLPPGADHAAARGELERLLAEMKPAEAVARMWVRDLVVQACWANFVLGCFGPAYAHAAGTVPGEPVPATAAGAAWTDKLDLLGGMLELSMSMRRERDRVVSLYDTREANRLKAALAAIEAQLDGHGRGALSAGDV
jgi:hypothetical protein